MADEGEVLRTPDACFENLPLWDYEPKYFVSRLYGLDVRMAYYDLGDPAAEETCARLRLLRLLSSPVLRPRPLPLLRPRPLPLLRPASARPAPSPRPAIR